MKSRPCPEGRQMRRIAALKAESAPDAAGGAAPSARLQEPAISKRRPLVLLDAYGTLFAPVAFGSPAAQLCQLLAADGVRVAPERAEKALYAEIAVYQKRFPFIRNERELRQLEDDVSDLVLAELALTQFPRERMRRHLLALFPFVVFPDVEPALAALRARGLTLGVVSNFNAMLDDYLEELKLRHWFSVVVSSADIGVTKPDPVIFHAALERLGANPEHAVYVGDDVRNDYHGARQAGLRAVLLNRDDEPLPEGTRAIAALTDLPALLDGGLT